MQNIIDIIYIYIYLFIYYYVIAVQKAKITYQII